MTKTMKTLTKWRKTTTMSSNFHSLLWKWEKKRRKTAIEVAVWSSVLHIVTPCNRIAKRRRRRSKFIRKILRNTLLQNEKCIYWQPRECLRPSGAAFSTLLHLVSNINASWRRSGGERNLKYKSLLPHCDYNEGSGFSSEKSGGCVKIQWQCEWGAGSGTFELWQCYLCFYCQTFHHWQCYLCSPP